MNKRSIFSDKDPQLHFIKRASGYDRSSGWVDDKILIDKIYALAEARIETKVLDVATGTGKIAQAFFGRAGYVVGIDICPQMVRRARKCADKILLAPAEKLPFKDNTFDVCVCRQGLQFMEIGTVLSEVKRVLKPAGRIVLCHLTAYGQRDKDRAFFIQKLRNPARKNFFLPSDFKRMLASKSFTHIESFEYISKESVNRWIDNGAINKQEKEKIKKAYLRAPGIFKKLHNLSFKKNDIFDSMKMIIVRARKRNRYG